MTTIETARTLLAKESPELRRAVGELLHAAIDAGQDEMIAVYEINGLQGQSAPFRNFGTSLLRG